VVSGGRVFGWRNHAHKLGRDIWSDHFSADGEALEPFGLISSQHPQIIRKFPEPKYLRVGDTLQLHCVYDNAASARPSGYGSDENGEMCNQYMVAELSLQMQCNQTGRSSYGRRISTCRESPHVYVDEQGTAQPLSGAGRSAVNKKPMRLV